MPDQQENYTRALKASSIAEKIFDEAGWLKDEIFAEEWSEGSHQFVGNPQVSAEILDALKLLLLNLKNVNSEVDY